MDESPPQGSMKFFKVGPVSPKSVKGLDPIAYETAREYFLHHEKEIKNRRYLTIIDYTKPSYMERMFVVDLKEKRVKKYLVAHGKCSGLIYAVDFSNEVDSLKSSRGFFLTGEKYEGKNGPSLRLTGLEPGINDNAMERGIVVHGADYVGYGSILRNGGRLGLSWGCPVLPKRVTEEVIDQIKDGSILYIHAGRKGGGKKGNGAG